MSIRRTQRGLQIGIGGSIGSALVAASISVALPLACSPADSGSDAGAVGDSGNGGKGGGIGSHQGGSVAPDGGGVSKGAGGGVSKGVGGSVGKGGSDGAGGSVGRGGGGGSGGSVSKGGGGSGGVSKGGGGSGGVSKDGGGSGGSVSKDGGAGVVDGAIADRAIADGDADSDAPTCLSVVPTTTELSEAAPKLTEGFGVTTCAGEPLPGLTPCNFSFLEDGVPISTFEAAAVSLHRVKPQQSSVLLLLDLSASAFSASDAGLNALQQASEAFAESVMATGARLAVYGFDGRPDIQLIQDYSTTFLDVQGAIENLSCDGVAFCADPSTNLYGAEMSALDDLDRERTDSSFQTETLVVFTYNQDQASRHTLEEAASRIAQSRSLSENYRIQGVLLGGELRQNGVDVMKTLAPDGVDYAVDTPSLIGAFESSAARIVGRARSFYAVDYCSPRRSGTHVFSIRVSYLGMVGQLDQAYSCAQFGSAKCTDLQEPDAGLCRAIEEATDGGVETGN